MTSVSLKTIGCKLNQSESDTLMSQFRDKGFLVKPYGEEVDVTIINTCTVTHAADSDCRNFIRQAKRISPKAKIVVVGCYAEVSEKEIAAIPGVDLILGNKDKFKLFEKLESLSVVRCPLSVKKDCDSQNGNRKTKNGPRTTGHEHRTRAFLKIQDGCNFFCAYCIVPFARGNPTSLPVKNIIEEAHKLVNRGFQEIVVTGVNIGLYQYTSGEKTVYLEDILAQLERINGIIRIRTGSVEPNTIRDELFQVMRDSHIICPHMHIPLQSGNDKTLKAMKRRYTCAEYQEVINRYTSFLPDAALGTDIIVGFPGETADDFETTKTFVNNLPYTYFHVFSYSDRTGTVASQAPDKVAPPITKERSQILRQLGEKKKEDYIKSYLGKTLPVHFDNRKNNLMLGYTPNFIRVGVESEKIKRGEFFNVVLKGIDSKTRICTGSL
ncbi:tRNA (N(6)-L-threonylcarbamoyladenosine(37)-C(2))-methylthiotransferase MtaB [bacterium]|nr:tRNA (N(6)-L-threonylcarbamoyladenosine(37)-C(2))-methylthiotransferase MtaB [bacterium]